MKEENGREPNGRDQERPIKKTGTYKERKVNCMSDICRELIN